MTAITTTPATTGRPAAEAGSGPVLGGWSGDADYFRFQEHQGYQPQAVMDVLHGRVLGAVFRGMVPAGVCTELAERFWQNDEARSRDGEAPVRYIGAYHYHKTTETYLDECAEIETALDDVLAVKGDPLAAFYDGLAGALAAEEGTVRRAAHQGRQACRGVLRSWFGRGEYALLPHEDRGQCREPQQADFEIQGALDHQICALNICLENGAGGRLGVWNIQPDEDSKRRLGTEYTGSPYPIETLDGVQSTWLTINPGDVYIFNGSHVHAVEPSAAPGVHRTTLSGLFAFIDDTTVVSWT
ncbi:hypothetical protein [Streptomyces rhizosphaerihabitans]|uniref:hypothetical protein n=1 Tax=Streptomyces rhizosphaerihabitans TaxID=1266770 RepID=UPI0021C1CA94|nr:hypothetical protein [Streptomyces rhizosphaerihabitans]MCT9008503.1 hypothetical protein [Streptomyces rhizosphaerihabitans]